MKKITGIAATMLAVCAAASLAGCSGCSNKTKNTALTNSNWYTGTSYKGIQPSFVADDGYEDFKEIITYDVSFDANSASNKFYSAQYTDGSYSTEFYATYYDWTAENIPVGYNSAGADKELVYYYKTQFNVSVRFEMKTGEASDVFNDSVVTECYFRAAGKNLQPVYSRQEIVSASPANQQPSGLEAAYHKVDVAYENFYNYDCTQVTSIAEESGEKTEKVYGSLQGTNYSLFDNSSLYIAVRSLKLSADLSQTVSLFSAAAGGVSSYTVSGTDTTLGAQELATITAAMEAKGLYSAAEGETGIPTVGVNVNYSGGALQGTTQTVWYAAITDADNNIPRATMLKLSIPVSYGLGTLNITLKEVVSALWNK